jgi:hypothetical protein
MVRAWVNGPAMRVAQGQEAGGATGEVDRVHQLGRHAGAAGGFQAGGHDAGHVGLKGGHGDLGGFGGARQGVVEAVLRDSGGLREVAPRL